MKNNKWLIVVLVILVVITFLTQGVKKEAGVGLAASRIWSGGVGFNHVLPGATITATYTPETFNYFAIIEPVPSGWTPDKSISPDGKVRTSADGTSITIIWTAPSTTGTYTFDGEYFVNPDTTYTLFTPNMIDVCGNQDHSACYNGNRYWYTSCNDLQGIRETCSASSCTTFGTDTCDGLTIKHSRTCYTTGCSVDVCTNNPYTDTQINTLASNSNNGVCVWQCTSGVCDQNTPADTNYDGCVHDSEFPIAVNNWKQQTGGITDIIFPSVVSKWKNMENCV